MLPIDKPNVQAITTRIPIGVIAAIIPWNSQMFLTATKVAPALAMGNTVVIKSSELAPAVLFEFAKLVEKTGIPKGVVNVITGFGDPCGKALTTHNLVEKVAFTGGPETARHIIRNSAENLSEVSLELGGKSPVAVFDDAEQENAINGITAGIFGAIGQSCIAGSRVENAHRLSFCRQSNRFAIGCDERSKICCSCYWAICQSQRTVRHAYCRI